MQTKALIVATFLALPMASQAFCYAEAGARYHVNPELLKAIAYVESRGRPEATNLGHLKRTKSYDIGVMQINSSWLGKLAGFGITEEMLRDPCQNVMVGAWILSHHMREDGADWNGVGAYNASCRTLSKERCAAARGDYTWKVYRALLKQQGKSPDPTGPSPIVATASRGGAAPAAVAQPAARRISSEVMEEGVAESVAAVSESTEESRRVVALSSVGDADDSVE